MNVCKLVCRCCGHFAVRIPDMFEETNYLTVFILSYLWFVIWSYLYKYKKSASLNFILIIIFSLIIYDNTNIDFFTHITPHPPPLHPPYNVMAYLAELSVYVYRQQCNASSQNETKANFWTCRVLLVLQECFQAFNEFEQLVLSKMEIEYLTDEMLIAMTKFFFKGKLWIRNYSDRCSIYNILSL